MREVIPSWRLGLLGDELIEGSGAKARDLMFEVEQTVKGFVGQFYIFCLRNKGAVRD